MARARVDAAAAAFAAREPPLHLAVAMPALIIREHAAPRPEQARDDGVEGAPRGGPAVDEDDGGGRRACGREVWGKTEGVSSSRLKVFQPPNLNGKRDIQLSFAVNGRA